MVISLGKLIFSFIIFYLCPIYKVFKTYDCNIFRVEVYAIYIILVVLL